MADQVTVTNEQLAALATKLEGMRDQFSPDDREALFALLMLAGDGIAARGQGDVQGFAVDAFRQGDSFTINFARPGDQGTQGILIGLLKNGTPQVPGFHFTPGQVGSS